MHHIVKSALVPYSSALMYQLVNQVKDYPQFLYWCQSACVISEDDSQMEASITVNQSYFKQTFTTVNELKPNTSIMMRLKDGPFDHLVGQWQFTDLSADGCRVDLDLVFSFRSKILDLTLSPIFSKIAASQLDAFIAEAKRRYDQ